jgi:integrase
MVRRRVDGWKFVKDTTEHIYPKERQALDFLKESGVLTVEELGEKMNYKFGKATEKAVEITAYRLKSKGLIEPVITLVEGQVSKEMRLLSESSKAVKDWMRRLNSQETKDKFLFLFLRYFEWIKNNNHFATPDAMLEHKQLASNDKERYLHINLIEDYLAEAKLPASQGKSVYTAIRSFYKHNKAALPPFPIKFKDKTLKVSVSQAPISLDEIRILLTNAKPREKGIFLCCLQAGMDRSTFCDCFNYQAWPQLVKQLGSENSEHWNLNQVPVRIDLTRTKTSNNYYTFLSTDAIKALQSWLKIRETMTGQPMKATEPLFLTPQRIGMKDDNISRLFNRLAITAGLETKKFGKPSEIRYRFHPHELRDTLKSACSVAGVSHAVSEWIIGHSIDDLGYDKSPEAYPEHYRAEYKKVEHMINIFSNQGLDTKKLSELEKKVEDKEKVVQALIENGNKKDTEISDLRERMQKLELSKPALEALLKKVEELEKQVKNN